jgi:DnaJ-class molecular chaperone
MNVQCPDCHGTGKVRFMQTPTAPEVLCHRCGGSKVIAYRDPAPLYRGRYRLDKCDCERGSVTNAYGAREACPKCKGEGAVRVKIDA